jgi:hypothetical protein
MKYLLSKITKGIMLMMLLSLLVMGLNAQDFKVTPGMTLKYNVKDGDNKYTMWVMVKDVFPEVTFDWLILNDKCIQGRIKISSDAWKTADKENNLFDPGYQKLSEQTCLWVSQYIYSSLKNNGDVKMTPDQNEKHYVRKEYQDYPVKIDGKQGTFHCMYVESDDPSKDKFWIADAKTTPIILKMNFGFSMELYEINSVARILPQFNIKGSELADLPGKSLYDPQVYSMTHPIGDSCDFIPTYKPDKNGVTFVYKCQSNGYMATVVNDVLTSVSIYNNIKGDEDNSWTKYPGELPFSITFDMKREAIEKILGAPNGPGGIEPNGFEYKEKNLIVIYNSNDPKKAKLKSITLYKK